MTVWLIALGVIAVGLLLFACLLGLRAGRGHRSAFLWSGVSLLICIALNIAGLAQGFGNEPMEAPGNYVPFIIIINMFFLPAGLLAMFVGWHDYKQEDAAEKKAHRAEVRAGSGRLP